MLIGLIWKNIPSANKFVKLWIKEGESDLFATGLIGNLKILNKKYGI